ncbi:MAG: PNGase F N-terminal domain-containing protein [Candidatus Krumholzibacteriia bacterium]
MLRPLLLLVLAATLGALVTPAAADTLSIPTFTREFFNWATVHEQTFAFPEQQLFSQVTCNIVISCPSAPADCDPWDRLGWLRLKHEVAPGVFEDYELVRFVTPYDITYAGGPQTCAWSIDVTDYQFLLHDQVTLKAYIETWMGNDNGWKLDITFAMVQGVPEREPFAIVQLYSGRNVRYGDPDLPEADALPVVPVTVPGEATWAAAKIYSTGHGFLNTDNAAEFSYKWQSLSVDAHRTQHYLWRADCDVNPARPSSAPGTTTAPAGVPATRPSPGPSTSATGSRPAPPTIWS